MAEEGSAPLPELARSLRSLGRPTDTATDAAHAVVFAPLLDARARASRTDEVGAVAAFRGSALAARIEALGRAAAVAGQADPATGRARIAAIREALEPLRERLLQLDRLAAPAGATGAPSPAWSAWIDQLRLVFSAADGACHGVARVLAEEYQAPPPARRSWFGGRGSAGR